MDGSEHFLVVAPVLDSQSLKVVLIDLLDHMQEFFCVRMASEIEDLEGNATLAGANESRRQPSSRSTAVPPAAQRGA